MKTLATTLQGELLAILCFKDAALANSVLAYVPAKHFDPVFKEWVQAVVEYREQYNEPPGEAITPDILQTLQERDPSRANLYQKIWTDLVEVKDIKPTYVLNRASKFARYHRVKKAARQSLDFLENDQVDEAEAAMVKVGQRDVVELFDHGTTFFNPAESLRFLDQEIEAFPTGIPFLDRRQLGPTRKALHMLIGVTGGGKSWWLLHLLKQAMMHGLRVVYISLEMSEEKICRRLVQSFFGVSKRDAKAIKVIFDRTEQGTFAGASRSEIDVKMTLKDPGVREKLTAKLRRLANRPSPIIKDFPTRSLTVQGLEAYLDLLYTSHKYTPDLVCVDYGTIMKPDSRYKDRRYEIGETHERLRGIAVDRNIAIASVVQSNRLGKKATTITEANMAEDWSIAGTADVIMTYSQTQAEYDRQLARLYVAKGRDDEDKFRILISQAYRIGAFCMDSVLMGSEKKYWEKLGDREESEEADD